MKQEEQEKYEQRLVAIANTRLMFNTLEQLETFLGNHSIHSNGIRRCFPSAQRLRAAYRDLKVEAALMTDDMLDLDSVMRRYERAWEFYRRNLARRKSPEQIALRLLSAHYKAEGAAGLSPTLREILREVDEAGIDVAFLAMLLLKWLPGFDSKGGDVADIDRQFDAMLEFLDRFTAGCGIFDVLPVIKRARCETLRTRLMLIHHFTGILDTFHGYSDPHTTTASTNMMKSRSVPLDMAGYWATGTAGEFWHFEPTSNEGVFFATHYVRESQRLLTATRYTLFFIEADDGRLNAYVQHPAAMKHRLKGLRYTDEDHVWYMADMPAGLSPDALVLSRTMPSAHWPERLEWRRITAPEEVARHESIVGTYVHMNPYEDCGYDFRNSIYAITRTAVYVYDERLECLYRLPADTEHGFGDIAFDDNVGILEIGPEGRRTRYLAIDERLLYIPLTPRHLRRYGIDTVTEIT